MKKNEKIGGIVIFVIVLLVIAFLIFKSQTDTPAGTITVGDGRQNAGSAHSPSSSGPLPLSIAPNDITTSVGQYHAATHVQMDGSNFYVTSSQTTFDLGQWPLGNTYNANDYATVIEEPFSQSRSEIPIAIMTLRNLDSGGIVNIKWFDDSTENIVYELNIQLSNPPAGEYWLWYQVYTWIGHFPHEISHPGQYTVVFSSNLFPSDVSRTITVTGQSTTTTTIPGQNECSFLGDNCEPFDTTQNYCVDDDTAGSYVCQGGGCACIVGNDGSGNPIYNYYCEFNEAEDFVQCEQGCNQQTGLCNEGYRNCQEGFEQCGLGNTYNQSSDVYTCVNNQFELTDDCADGEVCVEIGSTASCRQPLFYCLNNNVDCVLNSNWNEGTCYLTADECVDNIPSWCRSDTMCTSRAGECLDTEYQYRGSDAACVYTDCVEDLDCEQLSDCPLNFYCDSSIIFGFGGTDKCVRDVESVCVGEPKWSDGISKFFRDLKDSLGFLFYPVMIIMIGIVGFVIYKVSTKKPRRKKR